MSNTPRKCPVCNGAGKYPDSFDIGIGTPLNVTYTFCRACSGTGIVWESNPNAVYGPPQETQEQCTRRIQQMLRNDSGDFRDTPTEPK